MARLQSYKRPARRGLRPIGKTAFGALRQVGAEGEDLATCARIARAWNDVVGKNLARHLWPMHLARGVLTLGASTSAWLQEARFMENEIRKNVAEQVPGSAVRELRFRMSRKAPAALVKAPRMPDVEEWLSRPLPAEVEKRIEETVAGLEDRALAECLKRIFRLAKLAEAERADDKSPRGDGPRALEDRQK